MKTYQIQLTHTFGPETYQSITDLDPNDDVAQEWAKAVDYAEAEKDDWNSTTIKLVLIESVIQTLSLDPEYQESEITKANVIIEVAI